MTASKRIGKYPVIREIGSGAMGKVFEGFDPDTGAKVAIKILRAEHLSDSQAGSVAARFGREAQVGLQLHHPNIVTVHEYGEQGRIKFIAMEFLEGRELRQLMREKGRFGIDETVSALVQLLAALDCSHRHGIVHRDIKPSNMMVIAPWRIKVMDFGIAHIDSAAFTQVGTLLGTPSYMSPEQMGGETIDGRADLWAAGVILYQMFTGRVPFSAPNTLGMMREVMHTAHTPMRQLLPDLPPAFDEVLDRALAKRREDRYQTAIDFARALRRAADPSAGRATDGVDLELAIAPAPAPAAAVDLPLDAPDDNDATVLRPRP